ncbi:MAG: tetratricopeptide repeat protein [Planctomycetota bacterium]
MQPDFAGQQRDPLDIAQSLEAAEHFLECKRCDLAERTLLDALRLAPQNSLLHCQLAWTYESWGRKADAEEAARTALELDPESANALAVLARLAARDGRHRDAERLYLDALRLAPLNPMLLLGYAALCQKVGQLEKSEQLARASLRSDPENARAHALLALVLSEQKRARAADSASLRSLSLAPDDDVSHYTRGIALFRAGRPFKARRYLREALRLDPTDPAIEEAYVRVDRYTRWTSLVMYYWSLLIERVPGQQYSVWAVFVVFFLTYKSIGVSERAITIIAISYVALIVYTWIAEPLTSSWIKMRPPR